MVIGGNGTASNPWVLGSIYCDCCGEYDCSCTYSRNLCSVCGKCNKCCQNVFSSTPHSPCCGAGFTEVNSWQNDTCCYSGECMGYTYRCNSCNTEFTIIDCVNADLLE